MSAFSTFNGYDVKDAVARRSLYVTPQMYDAKADGVTDDTDAISAAMSASKCVFFPAGTYAIKDSIKPPKDAYLLFDPGATLKPTQKMSYDETIVCANENITIDGLHIMGGNEHSLDSICIVADDCTVKNCRIETSLSRWIGIVVTKCTRAMILNNTLVNNSTEHTLKMGINLTKSQGTITESLIQGNRLYGCDIQIAGDYINVCDNLITKFRYGGGIVTQKNLASFITIENNIISNGIGVDADDTYALGIECWSTNSIIKNNTVFGNAGVGIGVHSRFCTIESNLIYDNGKETGYADLEVTDENMGEGWSHHVIIGNQIGTWGNAPKVDIVSAANVMYGNKINERTENVSIHSLTFLEGFNTQTFTNHVSFAGSNFHETTANFVNAVTTDTFLFACETPGVFVVSGYCNTANNVNLLLYCADTSFDGEVKIKISQKKDV